MTIRYCCYGMYADVGHSTECPSRASDRNPEGGDANAAPGQSPESAVPQGTRPEGMAAAAQGEALTDEQSETLRAAFDAMDRAEPTPINDAFEAWATEQWGPAASWPDNAWLGFLAGYRAARESIAQGEAPPPSVPRPALTDAIAFSDMFMAIFNAVAGQVPPLVADAARLSAAHAFSQWIATPPAQPAVPALTDERLTVAAIAMAAGTKTGPLMLALKKAGYGDVTANQKLDMDQAMQAIAASQPPGRNSPAVPALTQKQARRLFEFVEETRGYLNCPAMSPSLYDEAAEMMQMLRLALATPPAQEQPAPAVQCPNELLCSPGAGFCDYPKCTQRKDSHD